jgi:hypothetical protein
MVVTDVVINVVDRLNAVVREPGTSQQPVAQVWSNRSGG